MDGFYEEFLRAGIDLSPFGWERVGAFEPYFCTPRGAHVLAAAGVDGIHYCTIPGCGDTIFAVSPMNGGDCVHPIARDFRELLRLLLAGADLAALEQCYAWDEEQYRAFLLDCPPTEAQQAVRQAIRETFALTPAEDAFRTVKDLQRDFDPAQIPYTEEYYDTLGLPAPEEAEPWQVSYPGGFWSREGEAGREISLDRRFRWGGRDWRAAAVYVCPEGLVIDLAMEVDPAEYRAFLAKWDLTEGEPAELTAERRAGIERENPLNVGFHAALCRDGATARQERGCGICWLAADCLPEGMENEGCAAAFLAHYGLDDRRCWALHRVSFPFPGGVAAEPQRLTLRLARGLERFPAPAFDTPAPGESVTVIHPLTGESYCLTVTEVGSETLPPSAFPDPAMEYPAHLLTMGYTLTPEHGSFSLHDCAEGNRPRRRAGADSGADGPVCAAVVGVIGGADGPTALIMGGSGGKSRAAVSALYFDPPKTIRWQPAFREKTAADTEVELL